MECGTIKIKTKMIFFLAVVLFGVFGVAKSSLAATYWVSPDGSAEWSSCQNATDPGSNYCSLGTANANAAQGDLIYLKGGTYTYSNIYGMAIYPSHSGTTDQWIVYKNAPGEIPKLRGTYGTRLWGIEISGKSYIRIEGIDFADFTDYSIENSSHHIEVANCSFQNLTSPYRDGSFYITPGCSGGQPYNCYNHDIWVHNNSFYKMSAGGGCDAANNEISEGGDALRIGFILGTGGVTNPPTAEDTNITVENNSLAYAGHSLFDSYGVKIVFKNNILHNEPWYPADNGTCRVSWPATGYTNSAYDGLYGHRVFQMTDTFNNNNKNNLVENNRFGYGSINPNNDGADSVDLAVSGSIFRYNSLYGSMNDGFMFKYGDYAHYDWQATGGNYDQVYNNTIYKNGYGYPYYNTCTLSTCPEPEYGIRWYAAAGEKNNSIKNNIVFGNRSAVEKGGLDIQDNSDGNEVIHNWITPNGDPGFVNPSLSDTTSKSLPDLHLNSNSKAIDGGTNLTQTNGAGNNSTSLVVANARYFQDGSWGAEMARGKTMFPDWIAVGSVGNIVEIKSIDYNTNTVTLSSPITWSDNDPVWLYINSDGTRVLYGNGPDYGAHEYQSGSSDTTPPAAPSGLSVN